MSTHTMYGLTERTPGATWQQLHAITWPAYRRWYLREGETARPSALVTATAIRRHLPELLPVWARLAELADFDDLTIRMLSMWNLPAFAPAGCSQVCLSDDGPVLVRNYDYSPDLFEWVSLSSGYLRPVVGTSDCLWGLLDGVNGDGLIASLTFGGDRRVGEGFGIPLVLRYVLETCATVPEAKQVLARVPIAMSYNVTLADRAGRVVTAHVAPGREAEFAAQPMATNHRWRSPLDPAHAQKYRSVERLETLGSLVDRGSGGEAAVRSMLRSPLYSRDYAGSFGTLYTACYRNDPAEVTYHWPSQTWSRRIDDPATQVEVRLDG